MGVDDKTKGLLLGNVPPGGKIIGRPCNHQGFLVPTIFIPQLIQLPPEFTKVQDSVVPKKGFFEKKSEIQEQPTVTIWKILESACLNCGQVIKFGPPPVEKPEEATQEEPKGP